MPLSAQSKLQLILSLFEAEGGFPNEGAEDTVDEGTKRPGAPSGYTNLEEGPGKAVNIGSHLLGLTPAGPLGAGFRMGTRAANASVLDTELEERGFEQGLSFGQQLGAMLGLNSYGTGGKNAKKAGYAQAQRRQAGFSPSGARESDGRKSNFKSDKAGRRGARDRSGFSDNERSSDLGSDGRHGEL